MDYPLIQEHFKFLDMYKHFNKDVFDSPYSDVLKNIYERALAIKGRDPTFDLDKFINSMLDADILQQQKLDGLSKKVIQRIENIKLLHAGDQEKKFAFVTVGYDDKVITPSAMKEMGEQISALKYFDTCTYVHEKYRADGIHHHTHFLFTYTKIIPKSKIIQYIFQIVNCKKHKWVSSQSFIDVKGTPDKTTKTHMGSAHRNIKEFEKYIIGDKIDEKLPFCKKDAEWRKNNNL